MHSIYFKVLSEQGFPGLALFLGLLIASWRSCTYVRKRARSQPSDRWAYDLASMLQVGLLAYLVTGAASTSSYFDLTYQILAMCVLLKSIWQGQQIAASAAEAGHFGRLEMHAVTRSSALPGVVARRLR